MVWLLRTFVVGLVVAVLALAGGAIALQQGGPGSIAAEIGSILLIAAVPLGLLTFVALTIRAAIRRARHPRRPAGGARGGVRPVAGRAAAGRAAGGRSGAGARPTRPRR